MADWKAVGEFAKANPYVTAAAVIIGGFSYFSARKAEERKRKRLKSEMEASIGRIQEDIPELMSEYERQADLYRAQGNVAGAQIYENAMFQLQSGGQTGLAYGRENVQREQMAGLLGQRLQGINLSSQRSIYQTQNQLASELNRQQINIDQIRANYAKQGIPSTEVNIGDVNTLKYV